MILLFYMALTALLLAAGYRPAKIWLGSALSVSERLSVGYLLSGLTIYLIVAALGPVFLDVRTLGVTIGILLAATAWGSRAVMTDSRDAVGRIPDAWRRTSLFIKSLVVVVVGISLLSLAQGMAPPNTFDSLHYHLALPKFDVEIGRISPQWREGKFFSFFPQFMSHQSRLWLMLDPGGSLTQMMHGNMAIIAAIGAARLARRIGLPESGAWLAALMVVSNRAVVWQSASAETDTVLAAVCALAMVVFLAWRERRDVPSAALFGSLMGMGVLVKYHGLAFGLAVTPLVLWELVRRGKSAFLPLAMATAAATLVMSPHLIRNFLIIGNPVFPLFNGLFNPDQRTFFGETAAQFGTGRELWDLVIAPWMLSIRPTEFFDGMMFGAPYLLALMPLALLRRPALRHWGALLVPASVYFVIWFYLLSQQVRFLLPVLPLLAVFAAAGLSALFQERSSRTLKAAAAVPLATLIGCQGLFVGIYAALRIPPAVGAVSTETYLDGTPTMSGANYGVCSYIKEHLRHGERYISSIALRFYCPLAVADGSDSFTQPDYWLYSSTPTTPRSDAIKWFLSTHFRFVAVQLQYDAKCSGDKSCISFRFRRNPIEQELKRILPTLRPLFVGPYAAVYDGREVTAAMRR